MAASFDIIVVPRYQNVENDGCLLRAESRIKYPVKRRLHLIDALIKCLVVIRGLFAVSVFFPVAWSGILACFIHWKAFAQESLNPQE